MSEFRMPSLGADMEFGTVTEWRVRPGDAVRRGEIVAVVDTEKAAIEVEVFADGVVEEILVAEGERVPVGTPLARIGGGTSTVAGEPAGEGAAMAGAPDGALPPSAVHPPSRETPQGAPGRESDDGGGEESIGEEGVGEKDIDSAKAEPVAEAAPVPRDASTTVGRTRLASSPAARALASELGVDLESVSGTGPGGAVVRGDVERAYRESGRGSEPAAAGAVPAAGQPPVERDHVRVTPLARRAAEELGVDVGTLRGSGPGGAVTREDVEHAAAERRVPGGTVERPPDAAPSGDRQFAMRQAIAAAVTRSKREIPHYYLSTRIDLSRALRWLERENRERGVEERVLPAALLLKATALALREHPEMNGHWVDGAFRPGVAINPGVAVSLRGGGLVAPALLGADILDLPSLMAALSDLVRRARAGGLRGTEMTEATITVTNLGDRGTGTVFGVIYPPQVAIVGFGRIAEEPWAENGMLAVRPVVHATLAADHRATDGHRGSLFLTSIDRLLQTPEEL